MFFVVDGNGGGGVGGGDGSDGVGKDSGGGVLLLARSTDQINVVASKGCRDAG